MNDGAETELLDIRSLRRSFARPDGAVLLVLDRVDLKVREGEIVDLTEDRDRETTLLRLIAGPQRPRGGEITYRGRLVVGPASGVAMVFQTFALFPWLTFWKTYSSAWRRSDWRTRRFVAVLSPRST